MDEILSFDLVNNLPIISSNDGVEHVDLTHQSFFVDKYPRILTIDIVSDELAGKPHVISKIHYGTENYSDLLCRFNGIVNPFDMQPGTRILIPYREDLDEMARKSDERNPSINASNKEIVKKMTSKDPRRMLPSFVSEGIPESILPNTTPPGTDNIVIENGEVILGANSTVGLCDKVNDTATKKKSQMIRLAVINSVTA